MPAKKKKGGKKKKAKQPCVAVPTCASAGAIHVDKATAVTLQCATEGANADSNATSRLLSAVHDHVTKGVLSEMLLPFYFREWIDLHSGEYFGSVVSYLRGLLDSEAPALSKAQRAAVGDVFRFAVELERRTVLSSRN